VRGIKLPLDTATRISPEIVDLSESSAKAGPTRAGEPPNAVPVKPKEIRRSVKRLSDLDWAAGIYTIIDALFVILSFFSLFLITRLKQPPATHETTA